MARSGDQMSQVIRTFWDPIVGRETLTNSSVKTAGEVINDLTDKIDQLTRRLEDLEIAYMELKMLGSDSGKIEK